MHVVMVFLTRVFQACMEQENYVLIPFLQDAVYIDLGGKSSQ